MLIPHLTVVLTVSVLLNPAYCKVVPRSLSAVDKKLLMQEMAQAGAPAVNQFTQGTVDVEKNKTATYYFDYKNNETGKKCHGFYRKFRLANSTKIQSQRNWKCDN